jgi:hypothetical protein
LRKSPTSQVHGSQGVGPEKRIAVVSGGPTLGAAVTALPAPSGAQAAAIVAPAAPRKARLPSCTPSIYGRDRRPATHSVSQASLDAEWRVLLEEVGFIDLVMSSEVDVSPGASTSQATLAPPSSEHDDRCAT